jgi:hypothetical protein
VGIFVGLAVMGLVLWGSLGYLGGQEKQDKPKPKEKQEIIETRGEVTKKPKYTRKEEKNDPKGAKVAKRAGEFTCDVHVDNRTNWVIHRVYIDGRYRGSVGRLGDLYEYDVLSGPTELYAEADFTDRSIRYWGPRTVNCPSYQMYTWRLH